MIDLESFLEQYVNLAFSPYIVVTGNSPIPYEVERDDLKIIDIHKAERKNFLKDLKIQDNRWKDCTGYYIHVSNNSKHSLQTCFLTTQNKSVQNVRNIIVVDDDSELEIFTGCLSDLHVRENVHNATTDIFVGKRAKVTFNMIHSWGVKSAVFPHTKVYVQRNGNYISNYVVWEKVKQIVANPTIVLDDGAKATMHTLAYVHQKSLLDLGGEIKLLGKDSVGQILSSVVSNGGEYTTNTKIEGCGDSSKGHIECNALLLNSDAKVITIPKLEAINDKTELTHEASLGRISDEQIEYLQTKGISEERAEDLIVKGFVNKSIENMPEIIKQRVNDLVENAKSGF